ncbi:hypothetical protein GE061_010752 [Apolygus lucorum]|uniref:Uncharacterized protein n=1 Tax=Apolygus lucorum TaxID=248454 RepID=A0A6A4KBR7_APOLU|nr:hypothetical protein GE061_010752 [Apolygus lucorum]
MASALQYVTVHVPHQPKKGFRREFEENPEAFEWNGQRVRRELKSLQDRLSTYYLRHRDERERHRSNLLTNLNQLDLYWFEWDSFDKEMFRFRCAWMNHLVDETIEQLLGATAGVLKDLWAMECEVE